MARVSLFLYGAGASGDVSISPPAIATTTVVPAVTIPVNQTVSPAAIATTTVIPTLAGIGAVTTVSPAAIATTTTIPLPVVGSGIVVSATAIATTTGIAGYSAIQSATVPPDAIATTTGIDSPTINTSTSSTVIITPAAIATTTGIPTPTFFEGTEVFPAGVASSTVIPTPSITVESFNTGLRVIDLIEETRRHLSGFQRPELNMLAAEINSTTQTIPMTFDLDGLTKGALIVLDDEIIYVWSTSIEGLSVNSCIRGYMGTTATSHAEGTIVEVDPRFPKPQIRKALQDEIRSWSQAHFGVVVAEYELTSTQRGVDLIGLEEAQRLLEVRVAPDGTSDSDVWTEMYGRLDTSPSSEYTSGRALYLEQAAGYATTLRVHAAVPLDASLFTDNIYLEDDIHLSASMFDIPPLGAAWRLLATQEIKRTDIHVQGAPRYAGETPVGVTVNVAKQMKQLRDARLAEESRRLLTKYPWRMRV